jgi:hypothetical protein
MCLPAYNLFDVKGVFETSRFIANDIKEKLENLKSIYLPIEFDHTMTVDQKTPFMVCSIPSFA